MRRAAIDIGTNSCRLLIVDADEGRYHVIRRELCSTRLGQGVDARRVLAPEAIGRTITCLQEFKQIMEENRVVWSRAVATSAVRDAINREEFLAIVRRECGMKVEVIDGEQEAALSYRGVNCGLPLNDPPLVVDLGGGSCEFILSTDEVNWSISLPLGAVRATEAAYSPADIELILSPLSPYRDRLANCPVVFVGGTATTLVAVQLALPEYDTRMVHGQRLSLAEIQEVYELLQGLSIKERQRLPGLQPERADIISAGALIVLEIMKFLSCGQITVSESDILDGIITEGF
ncbi:MAG: Ppx/GppA family phosphatase [Syntrophomonadaceae bacterium]|nr:Ppx/GppA family phosphatase [Syntrophomonadaceae bacterium]